MGSNTKSSVTLPAAELKLVKALQVRLKAKTKVEVVRRGLRLLRDATEREALREAYLRASKATRNAARQDLGELEGTIEDGLEEW